MPSETFFAFKYEKEIYKSSAMTDPLLTYLVKDRCNLSPHAKITAINSLIPKEIFLRPIPQTTAVANIAVHK